MNIIVGQSGGPTAVINGSLFGVITEGLKHPDKIEHVYGMRNGIDGFLKGNIIDLQIELTGDRLEALQYTPAAFLGSCRFKLPEDPKDPVYAALFAKFSELDIGIFLYIGGNDSMDTASKLSRYAASIGSPIRFIGIPKTIDNDLVMTDHTPGFGSAARYVASTVREICLDASVYDIRSVTIVEIMGRHAGWLTAASVLARKFENDNPVMICLPEYGFDQEDFLKKVSGYLDTIHNVIICVSEGIKDSEGTYICEYTSSVSLDNFGHKMLTGSGKYLENLIRERLGVKVRSIELNIPQRCSSSCRSRCDLEEAVQAGSAGVRAGLEGLTGVMIAFDRCSTPDGSYAITYVPKDVNLICNAEKKVPLEWISSDGYDVTADMVCYLRPLIQGETPIPLKDGLPDFVYLK